MAQRPTIAIEIAKAIAEWSHVECLLGVTLAVILETEAQTGLQMFLSLTSSSNQIALVSAAAKAKLTIADEELFSAVMILVRSAAKERHRLAHWSYAISNELPDDLLLVDPADLAPFYANQLGYHDPMADIERSKVYVLTHTDAQRIVEQIKSVELFVDWLINIFSMSDRGERAEQRQQLCKRPQILEALRQLHERRKSNPKARKSQPRSGRRAKRR
jgi:hypothetical protein